MQPRSKPAAPTLAYLPPWLTRRPNALVAEQLAVNIGTELLNIVPGRVRGCGAVSALPGKG